MCTTTSFFRFQSTDTIFGDFQASRKKTTTTTQKQTLLHPHPCTRWPAWLCHFLCKLPANLLENWKIPQPKCCWNHASCFNLQPFGRCCSAVPCLLEASCSIMHDLSSFDHKQNVACNMYGRKREQKAKRDIQGVDTITVSALHCYPSRYNIAAMNAVQFLLRLNTLRLVKADWYVRESNGIMQRNAKTSQTTASTISTFLTQSQEKLTTPHCSLLQDYCAECLYVALLLCPPPTD